METFWFYFKMDKRKRSKLMSILRFSRTMSPPFRSVSGPLQDHRLSHLPPQKRDRTSEIHFEVIERIWLTFQTLDRLTKTAVSYILTMTHKINTYTTKETSMLKSFHFKSLNSRIIVESVSFKNIRAKHL